MESIAYFLDKNTFEIIDVVELQDYELIHDEETNAKSTISVVKKLNATNKDFIIVKENNEISFVGIIDEINLDDNQIEKYTITVKYITNMFDRKLIVKNESLISADGIEDFILYTIEHEFTNSEDTLLNKTFLDVEILTHTTKQFSISNENGIYNFHTFINNMTQNYNIVYKFDFVNGRLKMTIENISEDEEALIDTNVSDITEYTEIFETNVTAKVTVLCGDNSEHTWYLLNDRTTTDDEDDENRAVGDIEVIYEEETANARQAAMNVFHSNSYKHLIQFNVNSKSKLYDISSWKVGMKIKIKNTSGEVIDSYISSMTKRKDNPMYEIKTGNIRITLLDKLNQEKLK